MSQLVEKRIKELENELKELKKREREKKKKKANYGVVTETDRFFVRTHYANPNPKDKVAVLRKTHNGYPAIDVLENGAKIWNGPERIVCYFFKQDIINTIKELEELLEVAPENPIRFEEVFEGKYKSFNKNTKN